MSRQSPWRDYDERAAAPQVYFDVTSTNGMMLVCNIIMAVVILVAMLRDQYSTTTAVIAAAIYFLGAMFFIAVVMSGTLTNIVISRQKEVTERRKWDVIHGQRIPQVAELPQPDDRQATALVQTPNYVAPAEDGIRREAYAWLLSLFDKEGYLDSRKVIMQRTDSTPAGRVRVKMPSKPAVEYLLLRKVLREFTDANGHKNGYGLRIGALPHRGALAELNI